MVNLIFAAAKPDIALRIFVLAEVCFKLPDRPRIFRFFGLMALCIIEY